MYIEGALMSKSRNIALRKAEQLGEQYSYSPQKAVPLKCIQIYSW